MPEPPTWDILIPSVQSRAEKLHTLLSRLAEQIEPGVAVRVFQDNLELAVGEKCQRLIEASQAEYVCFVGDDDTIAEIYVPAIAEVLRMHRPDYVGFRSRYSHFAGDVIQSMDPGNWREGTLHSHLPGTLNPIRRELALLEPFSGGTGEDRRWGEAMHRRGVIRSEVFIDQELYDYRFDPADSIQLGTIPAAAGPPPSRPAYPFVSWL